MSVVFVLDDNQLILDMAEVALAGEGFEVFTAATLEQFEQHAANYRADVVVLDVNMPEVLGDDIATVLRNVREWTVPILLFSSMDDDELERRAKESGAHAFLSKRMGVQAMVERVKALAKKQV